MHGELNVKKKKIKELVHILRFDLNKYLANQIKKQVIYKDNKLRPVADFSTY